MPITSTSTEFVILINRVDWLQTEFEWIVGGIGIVIAVVLVILGVAHFLYTRRLTKKEIEELKERLEGEIMEQLDEKAQSLQSLIDDNADKIRDEIEEQRQFLAGDIARSYALSCEEGKLYATSFNWWLTAAVEYSSNGSSLVTVAIKSAKDVLREIKAGDRFNINSLWEKMANNKELLAKLSIKHPTEAQLLEGMMKERASLSEDKQENKQITTST